MLSEDVLRAAIGIVLLVLSYFFGLLPQVLGDDLKQFGVNDLVLLLRHGLALIGDFAFRWDSKLLSLFLVGLDRLSHLELSVEVFLKNEDNGGMGNLKQSSSQVLLLLKVLLDHHHKLVVRLSDVLIASVLVVDHH